MASNTGASVDVLMIGAGPAGAATATLLAREGFHVLAADRSAFPRAKPCSEFMSPEATRILHRLGVLARLERAGGVRLEGLTVRGPRGSRMQGLFRLAGAAPWRATGLSVQRDRLDTELLQAAREAGVVVHEQTALEQLVLDGGIVHGAVLRRRDGGMLPVTARVVVGADGLRSRVARGIGALRHGPLRRHAFVTHMRGVECAPRQAEMFVWNRGYAGLNPVGHGLTNVALVVPSSDVAEARGRKEGFLLERCRRDPELAHRLRHAEFVEPVRAVGPFDSHATRVTAGGAALVGDAADFLDPFTGDGIVSALRGAELLAGVLADALRRDRGTVPARALAPYRRARRRAFAGKRAVARLIATAMYAPAFFDHALDRLTRRGRMAHDLIAVTGECMPARAVLNPFFLARAIL
jgi:flavin-dependent dehydrogenase